METDPNGEGIELHIKNEPIDVYEVKEPQLFGSEALGLHGKGINVSPQSKTSREIATSVQKTRLICIDDFVNSSPSPRISVKCKATQQYPDRINVDKRLQNLLMLPKAHKWVSFEFFYSDIDRVLFGADNEFVVRIKSTFSQLDHHTITHKQISQVRRKMKKPRRCSPAFFIKERTKLETMRQLIRNIQQWNTAAISHINLPAEIPQQMKVGTKVTARLRKPQDGLFTGAIESFNTYTNTYYIHFEKPNLGRHSVPDFEVMSNETPEIITLASLTPPLEFLNPYQYQQNASLCNVTQIYQRDSRMLSSRYSLKKLEEIVRLSKILELKKLKVAELKSFNDAIESMNSYAQNISEELENKYAAILIDLEQMNMVIQEKLLEVQGFCKTIAPECNETTICLSSQLSDKCHQQAFKVIEKRNKGKLKNEEILTLITDLTALLFQVKHAADSDQKIQELKELQHAMKQIKLKLPISLQLLFENCVVANIQRLL